MKEANPFLRAALAYAARLKWPVFPLKPRAKEPLTPHGHKDATLEEKIIRDWWRQWPKANIGIPTGIRFWVLDVDPRNGGEESLMPLIARHTALADTIRQQTGGGGSQYLYQLPAQQKIGCHTAVWPGIDVKGEGGYVVVPPSVHPSGKEYFWDTAKKSILEETINPANPWLIVEIMAATNHTGGEPFHLPEKIKKGEQHKTLFKMGSAMRHKGCGYEEILAALWEVNQKRCEVPGPRENIEKLAESICKQYRAGGSAPKPAPPKGPKPLTRDTAGGIFDADYPDPEPIVEGILYPGLTILGGRPKAGKSYFCLQLAVAVVSGRKLCKFLEVKKPCRCLYVSLEDRRRQIRSRLRRLAEREQLANLDFVFELDPLLAGGAAQLDRELSEHPVDLVILDSLLAAVKQAKRANVDVMQADYNTVAVLRELAEKYSLALVLVAHTRKAAGDFLDSIQGTSGTTAAADAVWVLQRTPEGTAMLSVTGRDVVTNTFGMKREDGEPAWTITGEGDEIMQSEARREIVRLLREEGPMAPSKIASKLRKAVSGIHRLLDGLCSSGMVMRTKHGTYQIPRPELVQMPSPNGKDTEDEL